MFSFFLFYILSQWRHSSHHVFYSSPSSLSDCDTSKFRWIVSGWNSIRMIFVVAIWPPHWRRTMEKVQTRAARFMLKKVEISERFVNQLSWYDEKVTLPNLHFNASTALLLLVLLLFIYIYIYIYIYTRFQKHCNLKNIYTYIFTFCFHIYSFVFAL